MVARKRNEAVLVVRVWRDADRDGLRVRIVEVAKTHHEDETLAAATVEAALSEIGRRLRAFEARESVPHRLS